MYLFSILYLRVGKMFQLCLEIHRNLMKGQAFKPYLAKKSKTNVFRQGIGR